MRLAIALLLTGCSSLTQAPAPAPTAPTAPTKPPNSYWERAHNGSAPFGPAAETALLFDATPHARELIVSRLLSLALAPSLPDDAVVRTLEFQAQDLLRDEGEPHARAAMLAALARIHLERGESQLAATELGQALQLDGGQLGALLLFAKTASRERRWVEAQSAYEKCLTLDSRNDEVLQGYARSLLAQSKLDDAARFLEGAVQVSRAAELRVLFADALEAKGRAQDAISVLMSELTAEPPDSADRRRVAHLRYRLALLFIDTQQLDEAEKQLRLAQLAELNPRITVALAEVQLRRNKVPQAVAILERVWSDIPAEPRTLWTAATTLARANRLDDARAFANHFTELAIRDSTQTARLQSLADALRAGAHSSK